MTVDDMTTGDGSAAPDPASPVSRVEILGYAGAAVLLVGWFLFGALVLRQGVVDSAGETLGTGFALLLGVSVVGAVRDSRR